MVYTAIDKIKLGSDVRKVIVKKVTIKIIKNRRINMNKLGWVEQISVVRQTIFHLSENIQEISHVLILSQTVFISGLSIDNNYLASLLLEIIITYD